MTNAEKIRQMNNEDLAEFFDTHGVCGMCIFHNYYTSCFGFDCADGILHWLEQESEE